MPRVRARSDGRRAPPCAGRGLPGRRGSDADTHPLRILVLDGLGGFRARWGDLGPSGTWERLLEIATQGQSVGIHAVITAEGTSSAPHQVVEHVGPLRPRHLQGQLHCLGVIRWSAMLCKQASNGIATVDISRIDSNDSLMSGDCFLNAVRLLLNMSKQTQKSGIGGIARNPLFEQKLRLE